LWDVTTGAQLATLENSEFWVYLAFNADGSKLMSTNRQVAIDVANWLEGSALVEPIAGIGNGQYVAYRPDGTTIAMIGGQGEVVIESLETGAELQRFDVGVDNVNRFAFSADGDLLALGSSDGVAQVVDVVTEREVDQFDVNGVATAVGFSPDSRLVGVIARTLSLHTLWIKNLDTDSQYAAVTFDIALADFAFSPEGDEIVVATDDGRVLFLDVSGL
jgi:WD40 repeat protein